MTSLLAGAALGQGYENLNSSELETLLIVGGRLPKKISVYTALNTYRNIYLTQNEPSFYSKFDEVLSVFGRGCLLESVN